MPNEKMPTNTIKRNDGWKSLKIEGILDFALIGILSKINNILAENNISIYAISTYNTDYILTKKDEFEKACKILSNEGYIIN